MFVKQRVRPFIYLFLLLITSLFLTASFTRTLIAHSTEDQFRANNLQMKTTEEGEWVEIGSGSATGGGISNSGVQSWDPSLVIDPDGLPIIAWAEGADNNAEIYVLRWDSSSWQEMGAGSASGGGISNGGQAGYADDPSLVIGPDGSPIIAWHHVDDSSGNSEIYVRRWNGTSWIDMGSGFASGASPALAVSPSGTPIIAWTAGSSGIYVRQWKGNSWVEMDSGSVSGNLTDSWEPTLAIMQDSTPVVAWQARPHSDWEIYVRRWNGTAWVEMGNGSASGGGISNNSGASMFPSLAVSTDGTPIIAWNDSSIIDPVTGSARIYVLRWNGTSWVEMGNGSATGEGIGEVSIDDEIPHLAASPGDTPIVASVGWTSHGMEVFALRWDGNSWVEMGGGVSNTNGNSLRPFVANGPDGTPIVAWHDWSSGDLQIYLRRWQSQYQLFLPGVFHK